MKVKISELSNHELDDITYEIAKESGVTLSRSAMFIMLEDDLLTEEKPFREYVFVKNIFNAMTHLRNGDYKYYWESLQQICEREDATMLDSVFRRILPTKCSDTDAVFSEIDSKPRPHTPKERVINYLLGKPVITYE